MTPPEAAPEPMVEAVRSASGGYRRLFRNRGFAALWFGQTISGIGDWLIVGLLIPMVIRLSNGSSMAVAGIMIAKIIPSLLIGSVLGVLVDRFDRRRLMIACNLVNGVLCLGLLATNMLPSGLALTLIYVITFLMEIANLLFVPAKNALIPMIVEEQDLAAANGLSYTTQQASMLVGLTGSAAIVSMFAAILKWVIALRVPVLSAFVASAPDLAGPQGGIVVDFFSFLVSAALITRIRVPRMERRERVLDLHLLGRDVVEAFQVLRERRELRGFLSSVGFAILGGGAIIPVGLVYVQQNLVGTVAFLDLVPPLQRLATQSSGTFMLVFMALGMLTGALVVPRFARRFTLEQLFVAGVAGFGIAMLGFSTTGVYWVASAFATAAGFLIAEVTVAGNTYIAETVPNAVRGRVFAALESVLRVALLASMVFTAPVGDIVGGVVRRIVESSDLRPEELVLTGSRITLIFASLIVLAAAVYAMRAIPWRRPRNGEANGSA